MHCRAGRRGRLNRPHATPPHHERPACKRQALYAPPPRPPRHHLTGFTCCPLPMHHYHSGPTEPRGLAAAASPTARARRTSASASFTFDAPLARRGVR